MDIPKCLTRQDRTNKAVRRLFVNAASTIELITQLCLLSGTQLSEQECSRREQIYCGVREKVLQLPFDELRAFLKYYTEEVCMKGGYFLDYVFFGTKKRDYEQAKMVVAYLLDAVDAEPLSTEDPWARTYLFSCINRVFFAGRGSTSTWWNLVESATDGDQESLDLLRDWFIRIGEGVFEYEVVEHNIESGMVSPYLASNWVEKAYFPAFPEHITFLNEYFHEVNVGVQKQQARLLKVLEWFFANLADFENDALQMWGLMRDPQYAKWGLRAEGFDRINIDLTAFTDIGITDFQFFPEGHEFPQARVRFWYARRVPFACDFVIKHPELHLYDNMDEVYAGDPRALMDSLRKYIALECMYQIVTGKKPPRQVRMSGSTVAPTPTRQRGQQRPTRVRPIFRRLPDGQKMSDQAKENSLNTEDPEIRGFGYLPPEGMTFVKGYRRGGDMAALHAAMYDAEPLFSYTDDDLGAPLF